MTFRLRWLAFFLRKSFLMAAEFLCREYDWRANGLVCCEWLEEE